MRPKEVWHLGGGSCSQRGDPRVRLSQAGYPHPLATLEGSRSGEGVRGCAANSCSGPAQMAEQARVASPQAPTAWPGGLETAAPALMNSGSIRCWSPGAEPRAAGMGRARSLGAALHTALLGLCVVGKHTQASGTRRLALGRQERNK